MMSTPSKKLDPQIRQFDSDIFEQPTRFAMCPWSVTKLQNLHCNGDYVIPWQVIRDTKSTNKTQQLLVGEGNEYGP